MKIIHTSDWHIGRPLFEYSLLEDQADYLSQLCSFAESEQVDAVIVAGDLYNRASPSGQAVELLDSILERLVLRDHIPVLAIAGNHDSPERLSFGGRLLEREGLTIAAQPELPLKRVTLRKGDEAVHVTLLPFFSPQKVRELTEDSAIATENDAFLSLIQRGLPERSPTEAEILVAHGFYLALGGRQQDDPVFSQSELSVGASDAVDLSPIASRFDYIALGHLHAPQSAGLPHARYSGSPLKYSLSEAAQHKSLTLLNIEGGKVHFTEHVLPPKRDLRILQGSFEALLDPKNQQGESLEDYVYANITGSDPVLYAIQRLRAVFPNILGLTFLGSAPQEELYSPACSAERLQERSIEELFELFYEKVCGEALSEGRREWVREILRSSQEVEE